MTPDERDLLTRFLDDLARSRPQAKDVEAAQRIEASLRANPDAAYVLVQHAILSDHALQDAQARIADLEDQLRGARARSRSSPVSSAPCSERARRPTRPAWARRDPGDRGAARPCRRSPDYAPPPPQAGGPFSGGGGLGNFLRGAGTTAAGVAGGAFLFEGLSGLFGHRPGFGGGYGFEGGPPVENTVINEYGGSDRDFGGGGVDYDSDNGDMAGDDYS